MGINRLSNGKRFIIKKHCYKKIYQTQIIHFLYSLFSCYFLCQGNNLLNLRATSTVTQLPWAMSGCCYGSHIYIKVSMTMLQSMSLPGRKASVVSPAANSILFDQALQRMQTPLHGNSAPMIHLGPPVSRCSNVDKLLTTDGFWMFKNSLALSHTITCNGESTFFLHMHLLTSSRLYKAHACSTWFSFHPCGMDLSRVVFYF